MMDPDFCLTICSEDKIGGFKQERLNSTLAVKYLWQESFAHEIHAVHVDLEAEAPLLFFLEIQIGWSVQQITSACRLSNF